MKKHIKPFKYLLATLLLVAFAASSFAEDDPRIEKKKTYTKSYSINGNDKIDINNQFGEVKINTWSRNEVKVDVTITVKASSDERAQAILDNINIEDNKSGDGVSFKTKINSKNNNDGNKDHKKGENQSMQINYEVNMPAGNPLNLVNQFGKSFVPDMKGPVQIVQKFGELVAGNLSDVKELKVEFGSAKVESIANCTVAVSYSEAEIKKMSGAIKGNFQFCGKVKLPLDNSVTDFNLNNSYSTIEIAVASGFGGDFDIHANFGDVKNAGAVGLKEEKEENTSYGPKFDKDYSGKTGNGACKVKIKTNFGSIRFM